MMIKKFRLFSRVAFALSLCASTTAYADEVTITPVYNSLSSGIGRSYIRLFNPSSETDTIATLRILSTTGVELARLSLAMPRLVSKQYELSELENLASPKIIPTTAAAYVVKVSTDKELGAYVQHVIYNDNANTFTNASACDTGRSRTRHLINVHTPKTGALGFPSQIAVQNDGVIAAKPYFAITDAEAGKLLTYYQGESINPQEVRVYNITTMLADAKVTLQSQFHINLTLTRYNEYVGFISHLVDNSTPGLYTNMAEMCIVPPTSPAVVAAPSSKFSESGYYTKSVDANGVVVRGSRFTRNSTLDAPAIIVKHMISKRADILAALIAANTTVNVVSRDEEMSESPAYTYERGGKITQTLSDGTVLNRQDDGTRGKGGTTMRVSEEYYLDELTLYQSSSVRHKVTVHEFTHTIHAVLRAADAALNTRIKAAYDSAMAKGLWKGTYSSVSAEEYLAQGGQVWFQTGSAPSGSNNSNISLKTRAELKAYDLELHDILALIFPAEYIPGIPRTLNADETGASAQERAASVNPLLPPEDIRNKVTYQ